jgi:hypothetical protein
MDFDIKQARVLLFAVAITLLGCQTREKTAHYICFHVVSAGLDNSPPCEAREIIMINASQEMSDLTAPSREFTCAPIFQEGTP